MMNPVWSALFEHMQRAGNDGFFRHIHFLFNQMPEVGNMAQWLFCLLWDRASIPLEFWSYPAAERYLATKLPSSVTPDAALLRQWGCRLGLKQAYPSIVTDYNAKTGIPEKGFDARAFTLHGFPYESAAAADNYNIS